MAAKIKAGREYKRNGEIRSDMQWPEGMQRVALAVEYQGGAFSGFQIQPGGIATVQRSLQEALSKVANEPITLVCAGRTDAGVHATAQIVHFDTRAIRPERAWLLGIKSHLPVDVSVCWARNVIPAFHARFSARSRTYRYLISDTNINPALLHNQITWSRKSLDVALMQEGAKMLVGEHDFTSLRASFCNAKSPVRCIEHVHFTRLGSMIIMEIKANAFLHHMVRNIVGVLMDVGSGEKPASWVREVLQAKDRSAASITAPPFGLYLVAIEYDGIFNLPKVAPGPLYLDNPIGSFGAYKKNESLH